MRYFLGLDPDAKTKLAIQAWREKALPEFERPVPVANFHVTSLFLGQLQEKYLDTLCRLIDELEQSAFSLHFDELGYWSKPKVLFLGCQQGVDEAILLADKLTHIAKKTGIQVQERSHVPHITLARKCPEHAPAPLIAPDFECRFEALHLFESVSGKQGVQYPIRHTWPFQWFRNPGRG